jgi:nicotinamide riboside kinase
MTIGLTGPHRTGKTTLARAFAEKADLAFVETSTSAVFKELGFDPKADYDFTTRLYIQRKVLEDMNRKYCEAKNLFITDRTPLDALAYLLADVQRTNVTDGALVKELGQYQRDCFDVLNRHFAMIMVIQPGIPLVEEEGKAPANEPYIEHLNALIMGLAVSSKVRCKHFQMPRHVTDLDDRINALNNSARKVHDGHLIEMADLSLDGSGVVYVH